MADEQTSDADLDAFFSAASSRDPGAIQQAAENVTGGSDTKTLKAVRSPTTVTVKEPLEATRAETPAAAPDNGLLQDLEGKFIAVESAEGGASAGGEPFVLIPAHIHTLLPWWVWGVIGMSLVVLVVIVVMVPGIKLDRLAVSLGDANPASVQSAMRQLVIRGDEKTVDKLYDVAFTRSNTMPARLRAIDTLSLIRSQNAERALLRLELSSSVDTQVREAAIAARKQREAANTRGGR